MDVRVVEPARLDQVGAELVAGWLKEMPAAKFLAAMGTSPLGVYAQLAGLAAEGRVDMSRIRLVQLDEYVGVADDDRRCLFGWLLRDVATRLGVDGDRMLRLHGDAGDPRAEAARHDAAIAAVGGLDVCLLGLGPNGHLGFNEPPSGPGAPTRVVDLAEASIESNARYWGSTAAVPQQAITVGMDRLLAARRTLLVVRGAAKRDILRGLVTEAVDNGLPASHLRGVPGTVLLADTEAWPSDVPPVGSVGP
jgi:glucosamine-6-phosphate deaminase